MKGEKLENITKMEAGTRCRVSPLRRQAGNKAASCKEAEDDDSRSKRKRGESAFSILASCSLAPYSSQNQVSWTSGTCETRFRATEALWQVREQMEW